MKVNSNAPVKFSKTSIIHADIEMVWNVLSDIDNWHKWHAGITKSNLNGKLQKGETFDWKSEGLNIHSTFHTVERYHSLGWTGKALGIYAIHNWKLYQINGQTIVAVEESMEGILVYMFKRSFNRNLERGMIQWLASLKQECERRSPNC